MGKKSARKKEARLDIRQMVKAVSDALETTLMLNEAEDGMELRGDWETSGSAPTPPLQFEVISSVVDGDGVVVLARGPETFGLLIVRSADAGEHMRLYSCDLEQSPLLYEDGRTVAETGDVLRGCGVYSVADVMLLSDTFYRHHAWDGYSWCERGIKWYEEDGVGKGDEHVGLYDGE